MSAEILIRAFAKNVAVIRVKEFRRRMGRREALIELEHHDGVVHDAWIGIGDEMSVSWTVGGRVEDDPAAMLLLEDE